MSAPWTDFIWKSSPEIRRREKNSRDWNLGRLFGGFAWYRALPEDGKIYCLEYEPKHAEVSRESFKKAGLSDRAEILVGDALENLPKIEGQGPFDLIFIDADKPGYPAYLEWAMKNLRVGGVVLGDNTFSGGRVADIANETQGPKAETVKAIRAFNRTLATDPRLSLANGSTHGAKD